MTDEQVTSQQGNEPSEPNNYNVNFFKPRSPHSRADMKLITTLIVIWVIAVFGFQFLLMATSKPTPEPAYSDFDKVWTSIEDGTADIAAQQTFCRSVLSVLGKNIVVKDVDKVILKESLSWSVNQLIPADQLSVLGEEAKTKAIATVIGLKDTGFDKLMADLLTTSMVPAGSSELSEGNKNSLPSVMKLYLIHNRGKMTDTRFLGFPFHYWYTAQFLLILFVMLCLVYAVLIDKINAKHNFTEK